MEHEKTVLLVMDVQPGIIDRVENKEVYLAGITNTVAFAHKNDIPVLYVVVGFRANFPEVSPRNKSFQAIRENAAMQFITPQPVVALSEKDVLVVKHRISAFSGSDLDMLLRAQGIEHLVLAGIATSGVVLSTLREAADKDYQLTVLSDLCADSDKEVHSVLLEKIFPRQANVMTSEAWMQG